MRFSLTSLLIFLFLSCPIFPQPSLEEKIGQLIVLAYPVYRDPGPWLDLLSEGKLAGIMYLGKPFPSPAITKAMSLAFQSAAKQAIFIAIDQEGGRIRRIKKGIIHLPSAKNLADNYSALDVLSFGQKLGVDLATLGINMNLAPVMDTVTNEKNLVIGDRSFSNQPEIVSKFAISFATGLLSSGVIPVVKHFPGHGTASDDSHHTLPIDKSSLKTIKENHILPFSDAIRADLPVVMTAHVLYPALDPDRPATLSKKIIQGLLKEDLQFKGVVITDDLTMNALSNWKENGVEIEALRAGADLLLSLRPPYEINVLIKEISLAVRQGKLSEQRVNDAYKRVQSLKRDFIY